MDMYKYFFYILGAFLVNGVPIQRDNHRNVEQDVIELAEMVPLEKVLAIAIEYAIKDQQVKSLLGYLTGKKFKGNLVAIESSQQFSELADMAGVYNIDAFNLANKVNEALDIPRIQRESEKRSRSPRSPGDGVSALMKEAIENVPMSEIKEAYKYKIEKNPQLKGLMESILSGEAKHYLEPIMKTAPFLEIKKDLENLKLPMVEMKDWLDKISTEFYVITIRPAPAKM